MSAASSLRDRSDSFGWISIAFHWTSALLVIVLWALGKSIEFQPVGEEADRRSLHVTLGLLSWVVLSARVIWRFRHVHPRAIGQSDRIHRIARSMHYLLLALLSIMLVSGPLLAWTLTRQPALASLIHSTHQTCANLLALFIVIHIAGALKHLMFNDDETLARIFFPRHRD